MSNPAAGQPPREPPPPSGGGGYDRGGSPTARSLHGELASAALTGAMTDSPIPGQGATADERLEEALRRAGHGQPPSDPFPTPGFGLFGTPQDPSHGAFSMPSSFPPTGGTADERLQEALRRIGQTPPPNDPVGTLNLVPSGPFKIQSTARLPCVRRLPGSSFPFDSGERF